MKIITLVYFLFFIFKLDSLAQVNLVRNPSLEQYWECPRNIDQIHLAKFWSTIDTNHMYYAAGDTFSNGDCSPEYCNACATSTSQVSIPYGGVIISDTRTTNYNAIQRILIRLGGVVEGATYIQN